VTVCFDVFCVQCHSGSRLVEEPNGVKYTAQRMAKSCMWEAKNPNNLACPVMAMTQSHMPMLVKIAYFMVSSDL